MTAPVLALLALLVASPLTAQELTADQLAQRTLRADAFAWEGAKTRLKMVLHAKGGKKSERAMEVVARRHHGLLQTMVRFLAPKELAGTAFLMREKAGEPSEQYIYLSGLKRTRRVVGREREGSFMGSDFTYADMQRVDPKHTINKRLPDDKVGATETYVLESTLSKASGSAYGKLVTWVRKSDFVAVRTRFYDRKGKLVKTLYARKVKPLEGKPVVVEARMQSENGHATELIIESMQRRDDLDDSLFTPAALERF
ncbi:MAG: outer membrane lipoprotein-sorting protein [Myxococcales bacterium]|nr:outer membrane lipoprotein-sorting protein [Myxococcales bacterium]